MSEKDFADRHLLLIFIVNVLLWGTLFGGVALALALQAARFLIVTPIFGIEMPVGFDLGVICFSTAFICSAGYALYAAINVNYHA